MRQLMLVAGLRDPLEPAGSEVEVRAEGSKAEQVAAKAPRAAVAASERAAGSAGALEAAS